MDDFDKATQREMMDRELHLALAMRRKSERPEPTGLCLAHCGAEVEPPRLFCGKECAERFELMRRRGKR